jgi:twitching motility two-component system response regulator PilG
MIQFQAGQLSNAIIKLEKEQFTGTVTLTSNSETGTTISKVLAFWQGTLTFASDRILSPMEFAEYLKQKLNISFMDSALKVLESRVKNRDSVRELVEFINRFGLIKWEALEPAMEKDIVLTLESCLTCPGTLKLDEKAVFDLSYGHDCHGFSWESLQKQLVQRQQKWQALLPLSPDAIPTRGEGTGELLDEVKTHLETWVNGQRSLAIIATEIKTDPLELAKTYNKLLMQGWIKLPNVSANASGTTQTAGVSNRPVILSVDDSPIVQVSIQRAISDRYEVLCAKSAVEALNLLNTRKVELLLLDVTMPDIDGLELCRTIRNIGKFKDLPVIMLTAKDGFMDKVKGQFAGSTHYLTKPVDREKLLPVLEKYIPVKEAVA